MVKLSEVEKKKVLIITYYWPPAGGPGVQRVLKFVKYLPQFGWEPVVLTVENGEYPAIDFSLEKDIPEGIKVYKTKTIEPFRLFKKLTGKKKEEKISTFVLESNKISFQSKILSWVRSNFFLPDARRGWIPFAVRKASKIIQTENIKFVLTSSPPHSLQLIGLKLKKKFLISWFSDFRDPWLDAFWEAGEKRNFISQKILKKYEQEVFKNADEIITVTKTFKKRFEEKYPYRNLYYIPNGFDKEDYTLRQDNLSEKIVVSYFGSIAPSQNPVNLIAYLQKRPHPRFKFEFFGEFDQNFKNSIRHIPQQILSIYPYLNHNEVISKMQSSDLLLLLIPENRGDIVPGKLYEYLGAGRRILCLGPKGDAAEIIENLGNGICFGFNEDLTNYLDGFKRENLPLIDKNKLSIYTRLEQTKRLTELFEMHEKK